MDKLINIAIDGPASSGKGTVAKLVASRLNFAYIDSGAMYRAVALFAQRGGCLWSNEDGLVATVESLTFLFHWQDGSLQISVNGEDVTAELRDESIGKGASKVAIFPRVRERLLSQQRELMVRGGVVMDGRDIGSVVMPDAELKIFLDASVHERAMRRTLELEKRGLTPQVGEVEAELLARDEQDRTRTTAPLMQASDAIYVDTTGRPATEIASNIVDLAMERMR